MTPTSEPSRKTRARAASLHHSEITRRVRELRLPDPSSRQPIARENRRSGCAVYFLGGAARATGDEMIRDKPAPISIEEVTDAQELAQARAQRVRFDRNSDWLRQHATEVYGHHRGQYVVIAAQQAFAGGTDVDAWAQVAAAGIQDDGAFILYVPKERLPRIHVHSW
jgi:hypothetical protein